MINSKKRILLTLAASSICIILNIVAVTAGSADLMYRQIEKVFFFVLFTTRLLRYVLRTVLTYVQNAPGILVHPLRQKIVFINECLPYLLSTKLI